MSALSEQGLVGEELKKLLAMALWSWIEAHGEDEFTLHVWFFRKTFHIHQLHSVFALLLGPKPMSL